MESNREAGVVPEELDHANDHVTKREADSSTGFLLPCKQD